MIEIAGTYDIECAEWDRFVVGATYDGTTAKIHATKESLVDYLLSRGGTWWAHYGGHYDGLLVAEELRARSVRCQIDYARSRITRMVAGRTTLRDSYGLLPFSLEVVAAMAREPTPILPWPCVCPPARRCAGYCQLSVRPARDFHDYVIADCRVLLRGLHALVDFADTHGIDLHGTIGSTAWATAKRALGLPDADLSPAVRSTIEAADKGGRTVLVRPIAPGPGEHRDITSAYPAALASVSLPVGTPRPLGAKNATTAFLRGQAGCYEALVEIPPSFLPPLPWRHDGKLQYPYGRIVDTWPANELHAAEARGVKILEIRGGVAWHREMLLFGPLMRRWYEIRKHEGKKGPFGKWMRELANSLTGKFAEGSERSTIRMNPTFDDIVKCPGTGVCRRGCRKACGAWEPIGFMSRLWTQPYFRTAPSGHRQWSAYLKAATRIAWLTEAERHGRDLVAGNTDSLWISRPKLRSIPEGIALGAWETKHTWTEWEARAYNVYRYRDGRTGQFVIRASGAPPSMSDDEWRAGRGERHRGVESLVEAAKKGHPLFHAKHQHWTLPGSSDRIWYGDRKIDASGVVTVPVDAEELRIRAEKRATR